MHISTVRATPGVLLSVTVTLCRQSADTLSLPCLVQFSLVACTTRSTVAHGRPAHNPRAKPSRATNHSSRAGAIVPEQRERVDERERLWVLVQAAAPAAVAVARCPSPPELVSYARPGPSARPPAQALCSSSSPSHSTCITTAFCSAHNHAHPPFQHDHWVLRALPCSFAFPLPSPFVVVVEACTDANPAHASPLRNAAAMDQLQGHGQQKMRQAPAAPRRYDGQAGNPLYDPANGGHYGMFPRATPSPAAGA
jgi:hypothetical protein